MKRSVYVCLGISCIITVGLSTILYLTGGYIYLLFTTDAEVIAIGMKILHFLVPAFVTYLCIEIYSGALRGVGDCWIPMIMTALGVCVLRVVWILIAVPIRPDILTVVFSYPKSYYKQQIERNVCKTADHKEIERSFGITDCPQDSGTHII